VGIGECVGVEVEDWESGGMREEEGISSSRMYSIHKAKGTCETLVITQV